MKFLQKISIMFVLTSSLVGIFAHLKLSPPWITVVQRVDENYNVKCEGEGEKVWKHGNDQISNRDRVGPSVTVKKLNENAVSLRFNKIQKEFKGIYNCSTVIKGEMYTKGFELIVIKPVTFLSIPSELIYNEGDEIILDCNTEGEPTPIISWFFNNQLISATNAKVLTNHSLKIVNASWKNAGIYVCRAFQKILQTRDAELIYVVKVRHKPIPYSEEQNTVYGFYNESENITCQVHAYPVAYFIWYRANIPVDPKEQHVKIYNEENISILEVTLKDWNVLGKYNCESANPLGFLIQTTDLQLISKPTSPKLLIHEYFDVAVIISIFIEPYPTYDFICKIDLTEHTYCSYEEKWKRGISFECKNNKIKGTNKTHCSIEHLKPSTKYSVRATIKNQGGYGNVSEELTFRTRKDMPILLLNSSNLVAKNNCILFSSMILLLVKITALELENEGTLIISF